MHHQLKLINRRWKPEVYVKALDFRFLFFREFQIVTVCNISILFTYIYMW